MTIGEKKSASKSRKPAASSTASPAFQQQIAHEFKASGLSMKRFAFEREIAYSTLRDWVERTKLLEENHVNVFHERQGRPELLDEQGLQIVAVQLDGGRRSQKAVKRRDFGKVLLNAAKTKQEERNIMPTFAPTVSYNTKKKYIDKLGGKAVLPQFKTNARREAEADPRNHVSMYALLRAFASDVPEDLLANGDATVFASGGDDSNDKVIILSKKELAEAYGTNFDFETPATSSSKGTLSIGIKLMHIHTPKIVGPQVFVVADDSLKGEEIVIKEGIHGLSSSLDVEATGILCFCPTRCCNKAFFRFMNMQVVVPWLNKIRSLLPNPNVDAFYYTDGEDKALQDLVEPESLESLAKNRIRVGKTPASTSGVLQPADVSPFFKSTKAALKSMDDVEYKNAILQKSLTEALADRTNFSSEKKSKINDVLQRIVYCIKKTLQPHVIEEGFFKSGQYPLDFDAMLKQVRRNPPLALTDAVDMKNAMTTLVNAFQKNGCLTEKDMDDAGVPRYSGKENEKPKDARPLCNQRAALITAPVTVSRYIQQRKVAESKKDRTAYLQTLNPVERQAAITLKRNETRAKNRANKTNGQH